MTFSLIVAYIVFVILSLYNLTMLAFFVIPIPKDEKLKMELLERLENRKITRFELLDKKRALITLTIWFITGTYIFG